MARKKGLFPNGLSIGRPRQLNLKPKFIEKDETLRAFIVVKSSNVSKIEEIFYSKRLAGEYR